MAHATYYYPISLFLHWKKRKEIMCVCVCKYVYSDVSIYILDIHGQTRNRGAALSWIYNLDIRHIQECFRKHNKKLMT